MNCRKLLAPAIAAGLGIATLAGSFVIADDTTTATPPAHAEMKLPPGWTQQDMEACILAATPGKMHEHLAKAIGTWEGKCLTWMPGASEPMESECTMTVTPMMDGRFIKTEFSGNMPGMGPYTGFGISGFNNVTQKFTSIWIDNQGTGIASGTGELASDGKTTNWQLTGQCPIQKGPVTLRQIETITGENTRTMEMFGPDPKTGKEGQMMRLELTRK